MRLVVAALAVSTTWAAGVVVVATVVGSWWWSLTGGGLLAASIAGGMCVLARRRARRREATDARRSLLARPFLGPALLATMAGIVSITWLWPGSGAGGPDLVPGTVRIARPDGSELAVHVTRAGAATEPPIVVVHGGPGVADMAHDVPAFAALATDRDVYVYDQIGTGASSRLADPRGYTDDRAVQDLEAVRVRTGADRVVLLGHSWGARVATLYLSRYPARVSGLVLSAPGFLPVGGEPPPPGDTTARLGAAERARLYVRLAAPRNLFAYALTAADPRVAHAAAGDAEMDRRFAMIYRHTAPGLFCDAALSVRLGTAGLGYYANQVPQLLPENVLSYADPAVLASVTVPVLVIKPACDYLPWKAVTDYRDALPTARVVVLPDAGHQAYLERPQEYRDLVLAFLDGRALPFPTDRGRGIPEAYRGVR
ncbi:MAG TPA: alpha/beta hydrolase [Micromonosporaceae bacterium]